MKTLQDILTITYRLRMAGYRIVTKLSLNMGDISFEFTKLPTPNAYPFKPLEIVFYVNESYDIMYERAERCLNEYDKYLAEYATDDFKELTEETKACIYGT